MNTNSPKTEIWLKILFLLLGITVPIIVTAIFKDILVYIALGITVVLLILLFYFTLTSKVWKLITIGATIIVAVSLSIVYMITSEPKFEINLLGLLIEGDDTYYVTDPIIRTNGDLSSFETLTLSPLVVEVIPHYSGDKKYGNVVLRLSGDVSSKDIPLWADYDKTAQAQTVDISLADILDISGIKENRLEEDTNLMIGDKPIQEATITFSVIRLSEPDQPFNSPKELLIKNTPWKQTVSVVWRDGWFVDYALTNLGGDARFQCRINIAKTICDVGVDDLWFWGGAEIFNYGPNCDSFKLKTGETYRASFPLSKETLGKDFYHGRYLVQVYTYAERGDITFNSGYTYENSNDMWMFANTGNVETFVVCNDPGKTCEQTETLPIEERTNRAYSYNSQDELNNGITYLWIRTYPADNRSINQYILNYWIDPKKDGWAGFAIWFENPLDVSAYNRISFKLMLDPSLYPIWLDVEGKIGEAYETSRVGIGDGTYGIPKAEEQTVIVPFSAFEGIDWTAVDTLHFVIDSYQVPDAEEHEIRISEIEFIR